MRRLAILVVPAFMLLTPIQPVSASTTTISIEPTGVAPERARVDLGDAVRWANHDTTSHRITSIPQGLFRTSRIAADETSKRIVFVSAGTFPYATGRADAGIAGVVRVPVRLRPGANATPTPGAIITIRVATERRPHRIYDVQRRLNTGSWVTIARDTQRIRIEFQPHRTGTFWFRARMTDTVEAATSRWSPPREKLVAPPP